MTSKEALKELEIATNWSSDEDIDKDLYNLWGNVACRTIKKDLDRLEEYRKIEEELGIDLITLFNKYIKWQKLDTYNTKENDWVLVLCKDKFDGELYKLPLIAELRNDGKWYSQDDKCVNDYLEIVAWKNIDVIYECGKLTEEELKNDN